MEIKELFGRSSNIASNINPFKQDCIEKISFDYRRFNLFNEEVNEFSAIIYFRQGETSGQHRISAENFPDLYDKVLDFCGSL